MTREIAYRRQARADLEEMFWFIGGDNPKRAGTYIEEIEKSCERLCETPMIGVARPDLGPEVRILTLWRRVVVAYTVTPDRVDVLRVFSGGRDYEAILGGG